MNWTRILLDEVSCRTPALLFAALANRAENETCESVLDYLIGTEALDTHDPADPIVRSPLRAYYTSVSKQTDQPEIFYETVSHLRVLRAKLREHQDTINQAITLEDFLAFITMYEAADERMLNTSPYNQQTDAVQLMTVFKAKGLEFEHVFLTCCHDDVWGTSSRGNTNRLTLPANLQPIRHAGATDDERLRIFFVAITRAKIGLYLTSYTHSYSGKLNKRLKYLNEQEQQDGSFRAVVLPEACQTVVTSDHTAPSLGTLELDWRTRHIEGITNTDLNGLLAQRLQSYQLSPTHLNQFIDTEHGGPEDFFFATLLRFPQAPSISGQFGSIIHETLEWLQHRVDESGTLPPTDSVLQYFRAAMSHKRLTEQQLKLECERGEHALAAYLRQHGGIFKPGDRAEHNFKHEGVFVGDVHMAGKIDRLEISPTDKTITIVDYKTGKPHLKWGSETKLHKYKQQLYCYKLLVESSHTFADYSVTKGRLEFIEPDSYGKIHSLEVTFDEKELAHIKQLMQAVWQAIHALDFPKLDGYSKDLKGTLSFEADLLEKYNV
jgi:ATP-dependent exoDNAse (exonuclease V) beta subunit